MHARRYRPTRRLARLLGALLLTPAAAQTPLTVAGVPDGAPFRVTACASEAALHVDLALDPEWHAYARDVGGGQPVAVTLEEGAGFRAAGPLEAPGDARGQLVGDVRLTLPLERDGDSRELRARLALQVCDALECLVPMTLEISGEVAATSVLLVVAAPGERADRIAGWLRERGFETAVTTYEAVELTECDARDVVVADSDLFGMHGVSREVMARFPRTASPVVAVGFIGTEVVEAHGLAMTSGYI